MTKPPPISSRTADALRALESLAEPLRPLAPARLVDAALERARGRVRDGHDVSLAATSALASILAGAAREHAERLDEAAGALAAAAEALELSEAALAVAVGERAFLETSVLLLPPMLAAGSLLHLFRTLAGLRGAALWARDASGGVAAIRAVGSGADTPRARDLACGTVAGNGDAGSDSSLVAAPVHRHGHAVGAVTLRPARATAGRAAELLPTCAAVAATILDRLLLLERRATAERILVEAGEHRLRRLGLDLHDGPLQGTAQLAGELRLLGDEAVELGLAPEPLEKLRGRIDDLLARLRSVDDELRELASSFESRVVLNASFETALADEVAAFERRSGKRARFQLQGSLEGLSPSQRIALYRMLQEALANVRQHSGARTIAVRIAAEVAGVRAEIEDDGVGFDPRRLLSQSSGRRHLGLAGMRERAQLLGGSVAVESKPGGPTRVSIFLPSSMTLPDLVEDLVWALGDPGPERGGEDGTSAGA